MNRNENDQFKKIKEFIEQSNTNKNDIFYGVKNVESTNIPGYDAIAHFAKGYSKYIQITSMSNLVLKNKNYVQHANKYNLSLRPNFGKKNINDNINYLKKMGVHRKIIKNNEQYFHISDNFFHIVNDEENLDKKHNINTANLTNALYRSIKKKVGKYNNNIKKNNSCLVIIDESTNVFYLRKIVNFNRFDSEQKAILQNFNIQNYFNFIIRIAILETKFFEQTFFNEIQVYFRQAKSSDSKELYHMSNNHMSSKVNLNTEKIGMIQYFAVSMNNTHRMLSIIDIDKK